MPVARASLIGDIINSTVDLIQQLLFVVFGVAVLVFSWGIVKLIAQAGNPEQVKKARAIIWYGIIGIFVLVSLWGIINLLQADLGIGAGTPITPPQFVPR